MSEIKNGGLHQYGAESLEQQQFETAGVEGVNLHQVGVQQLWWNRQFSPKMANLMVFTSKPDQAITQSITHSLNQSTTKRVYFRLLTDKNKNACK